MKYNTNNFIGKSKIQLMLEAQEQLHVVKDYVRDFVEHYDTDNKVIGYKEGQPQELVDGFMTIENTFENLEDALDSMTSLNEAIQLLNRESQGRVYRVGKVMLLSECQASEKKILNIKSLEEI